MPRGTITVDVDDTVLDLVPEWLRQYNRDYGDNVQPEDIKSWAIHEYVQIGEKIYEYLKEPDLYKNVKPIEGSLDAIKYLRHKLGWNIVFATASYHAGKIESLHKWGFVRNDTEWIVSYNKNLVRADFLIDDRYTNVKKFGNGGILFARAWNEDCLHHPRFYNWKKIQEYFEWRNFMGGKFGASNYYIW